MTIQNIAKVCIVVLCCEDIRPTADMESPHKEKELTSNFNWLTSYQDNLMSSCPNVNRKIKLRLKCEEAARLLYVKPLHRPSSISASSKLLSAASAINLLQNPEEKVFHMVSTTKRGTERHDGAAHHRERRAKLKIASFLLLLQSLTPNDAAGRLRPEKRHGRQHLRAKTKHAGHVGLDLDVFPPPQQLPSPAGKLDEDKEENRDGAHL